MKKKTRFSTQKFPGLDQRLQPRTRKDLFDQDYTSKLSDKDKRMAQ